MKNLSLVFVYAMELISCVLGFFYINKFKNVKWKLFPFYLLLVVISEIIGFYLNYTQNWKANQNFYNYFEIPIEFLFFFWIFYSAFKNTNFRWLPIACVAVYLVSWLTDMFYISRFRFFFYSVSYTIGNLLLLILILTFFIKLANSNAILTFRQNMLFWVSLGLLLFYLGSFPYYGLRNTIAYNYPGLNTTYTKVVDILNGLMYLMFTFSFVWGKPKLKSL